LPLSFWGLFWGMLTSFSPLSLTLELHAVSFVFSDELRPCSSVSFSLWFKLAACIFASLSQFEDCNVPSVRQYDFPPSCPGTP
jgi:hypothetical protein